MYKRYLIPGVLLVIALVLFAGNSSIRVKKAQWLSQTIFLPFSKTILTLDTIQRLNTENYTLKNKLTLKALENLELNNRLKALQSNLSFNTEFAEVPFTMAEVIGYSGQFHDRNLVINKGFRDGIELDSPVVSADGIIGKVIAVNMHNSVILPMTNSQFQLAVMDKNTDVQGILQSDLQGNIFMNLIKLGSQISIGDTIVSSNLSQLFPKSYPVGKISMIKESQDNLFLSARVLPFAFVENLEHVFVLKKSYIKSRYESNLSIAKTDSTRLK